ncbi:hypothetical protein VTN77DRAFT_2581 [Rasamsonia byssochlamydoides]|uniref:uncharacterized protein n=1 Tax=Rasamsonia byssochlamydoides TaxID=89139 RepID=UPI003742D73D
MLMLESVHVHEIAKDPTRVDEVGVKQGPVSRKVVDALSFLYRTGGIRMFCKGLDAAIVYHPAQSSVTGLLQALVFRHPFLRPVAYIISSVLLAELHLHWTHATISATSSCFRLRHDRGRWKTLTIPALVHATAKVLMDYMPTYVKTSVTFLVEQHAPVEIRARKVVIITEVLSAFLMLALRFFVLLPASITLMLIEASFVPKTEETIVPSAEKPQRRARIAELFSNQDTPVNWETARRLVHCSTHLWFLELHIKKCLIQLSVELLAWLLIGLTT